jgi:hypothetical protein
MVLGSRVPGRRFSPPNDLQRPGTLRTLEP